MSRAEIISEISKMSHADRQEILRRIMEFEGDFCGNEPTSGSVLQIYSLKGHRVLTPAISQSELADEMFSRQ